MTATDTYTGATMHAIDIYEVTLTPTGAKALEDAHESLQDAIVDLETNGLSVSVLFAMAEARDTLNIILAQAQVLGG